MIFKFRHSTRVIMGVCRQKHAERDAQMKEGQLNLEKTNIQCNSYVIILGHCYFVMRNPLITFSAFLVCGGINKKLSQGMPEALLWDMLYTREDPYFCYCLNFSCMNKRGGSLIHDTKAQQA